MALKEETLMQQLKSVVIARPLEYTLVYILLSLLHIL